MSNRLWRHATGRRRQDSGRPLPSSTDPSARVPADSRPPARGQALVELALIVPILFFLSLAAIDLGRVFYCSGFNNVNTNEVRRIMDASNVITATMNFGQYVGQHNNGCHTALFDDVQQNLAGKDMPVPITGAGPCDPNGQVDGCFRGWAMFHITSADGASTKAITGYFLDDFVSQPLTVGECTAAMAAAGACGVIDPSALGGYVVRLSQ